MGYPITKKFIKNFMRNRLGGRYPHFGSIEFTRRCNSKCKFCPIGNEKDEFKEGEMNTEDVKKILHQFNELNIIAFSFLGGEPTLRKDLCEVADYAKELNIISQVSTNGILLSKDPETYTKSLDVIVISLDTTDADKYKEIRGIDAYDKVIDGIKECIRFSKENDCSILINTVVCRDNIDEIGDVIKFVSDMRVHGIMIDFATFHDYWKDLVKENSRYTPETSDWRKDKKKAKKCVEQIIEMKKKYPIITSKSYLKTFITENFKYRCHPYLFSCVNKSGEVAIPCWDSPYTKFYSLLDGSKLKDVWFSEEAKKCREKVKNCTTCYMHCIVEPSKVLGEPLLNLWDLFEWINTFRKRGRAYYK